MKYWVYKDSRILGPFDKDAFAGLPGVDSATLVSAGETAAAGEGGWLPAGEVSDLAAVAADSGVSWPHDAPPSTYGLLDMLQLESAGLVGDDDFPGAGEDLFQDAEQKKNFEDLLNPRPAAAEAELRRSKDRVSELTFQLELLYKRVSELESSQTDLMHRLAEKEAALRSAPQAPPAPAPAVAPSAAPPAVPQQPPVVRQVPPTADAGVPGVLPAQDWPSAPSGGVIPSLPSLAGPAAPAAPPPAETPSPAEALPQDSAAPASLTPAPAPVPKVYPTALHFKVIPTVRSFRSVSADVPTTAPAQAALQPAPAVVVPDVVPPPPVTAPVEVSAPPVTVVPPPPVATPAPVEPPVTAPPIRVVAAPAVPVPEPAAAPEPAPAPAAAPVIEDMAGGQAQPPATMSFAWGEDAAATSAAAPPSTQEVLARLSKPAPAPQTAPSRPVRSNKPFLVVGLALVVLLGIIGFFLLRQPKDLKQMVSLDDNRARLGAQPVDDSTRLPLVKPPLAAPPEQAPAPVVATPTPAVPPAGEQEGGAQPAAQGPLDAAIKEVKEFPLDGGRGTVAQWLQYSYNASPDAGRESWSASATGDDGYLVEYRFTPTARDAAEVHYLFAADVTMGLVYGKNLEAQRMLAGSAPRLEEPKPKAKARPKSQPKPQAKTPKPARTVARRAARHAAAVEPPKEVPLMPLPDTGELKPPAEDDAAFGTDTVNSGL